MESIDAEPTPVPDAPWLTASADVVIIEGPDAQNYLHSQISQDVRGLAVEESAWTFVLDPTGKIDALALVTRSGDESYELSTDPGSGAGLLARLDRFKIRVDATTTLHEANAPTPADLEHERIVRGWPRMGAEIVPSETIPAETGLTPFAVDFRKGCYPGQELVERMDSRGATPPRSLRRLVVEPGATVGDPIIVADGSEVGRLTSVSGTSALGYVKRGADAGEPILPS